MNEPNGAIGGDKTEYRKISGDYVEKVSSLESCSTWKTVLLRRIHFLKQMNTSLNITN